MKESDFIKQNKEKWLDFETNLLSKDINPVKTSKLFVQITEDLSRARTFYTNRSVRIYLNGIAKLLFNDINKGNKKGFSAFIHFWKTELPLTLYVARKALLISLIVFIACFTLGVITSRYNPDFAKTILSSGYVEMTNENIEKGDPMAVYKSDGELETFLPIFYNNIKVDFITFFSGIFMGIGTLLVMVFNGVMVGVFQYFFIQKGLFWESFLSIWTHGSLEIPTIILSGGAGLTLGKGLLFPGTYSRFQAFQSSGINGLKIIMGVAPVTLLAAFIEGFLTRHTSIPDAVRFAFILLAFTFVIIYFVWYPFRVARRTPDIDSITGNEQAYTVEEVFSPGEIRPVKKIIAETCRLLFKHFVFFGGLIAGSSLLFSLLVCFNYSGLFYNYDSRIFSLIDFFNYTEYPVLGVAGGLMFAFVQVRALLFLRRKLIPDEPAREASKNSSFVLHTLISVSILVIAFAGLLMIDHAFFVWAAFVILPVFIFIACVAANRNISFLHAISLAGSLFRNGLGPFLGVSVIFFLAAGLIFIATGAGARVLLIEDALIWSLTNDDSVAQMISLCLSVFQICVSFLIYMIISIISNTLLYYSLNESFTAENLIGRIARIKANR